MTRSEAGRLGGRKTAEKGPEFFAAIGKKGGAKTASKGPWHFVEIGRRGGTATKARRGRAWFKQIGSKS